MLAGRRIPRSPAILIANNEGLTNIGLPSLQKVTSGGTGNIVEIYSANALPEKEDKRFQELTGGRYQIYFHHNTDEEPMDDSTILVVGLIVVGVAVLAIAAIIIVYTIHKKEKRRKAEEVKRPELVASGESKEQPSRARPGSVEPTI
ncbi:hypothetical protein TELCIR_01006 [Teladorsagia circumcincta]|uniref:Receptor L-domain domain-containing protein n=1 Tax=Teladorsagia circumcincta TaxID=45464 RepID=A0A2G9V363_TELCI|nr:hypothetical protein TELCIR_01006 [Teladorsagia circumcincta]